MFGNISEQFQNSFKPMSELVAVNAKAVEQLAQQQTALFTEVLNEGITYAEGLSNQKDMAAIVEAQKAYAEGVQEKVVNAAKDAYAVIAETQEKAGEIFKGIYSETTVAPATKAAGKSAK